MNDDEINAVVAGICKWVPACDSEIRWDSNGRTVIMPPNYCEDLNAVHQAELTLFKKGNNGRRNAYNFQLELVAKNSGKPVWALSARTKAEALVKVFNWKEEASIL